MAGHVHLTEFFRLTGGGVKESPSEHREFCDLYDRNFEAIANYCLRRLSSDDAADATSEVFLIAWRKRTSLPPPTEIRLWLYRVAHNVVAHHRRSWARRIRLHEKAGRELASTESIPDAAEVVVRNEQAREVLEAMDRLRSSDRELLRLKLWDGLAHDEIGSILAISPHAVDMRIHRATRRLGKQLGQKFNARPHPIAEGGEL